MSKKILLPLLATLLLGTSTHAAFICSDALNQTQAGGASIIKAYSSRTDTLANLDILSPKAEQVLVLDNHKSKTDASKRILRRLVHTSTPAYMLSNLRSSSQSRLKYIGELLSSDVSLTALDNLRVSTRSYMLKRDFYIAQVEASNLAIAKHRQAFPDARSDDREIRFEVNAVERAKVQMRSARAKMIAHRDQFIEAFSTANSVSATSFLNLIQDFVSNNTRSDLSFIFGTTHPVAYYKENGQVYAWIVSDSTSIEETPIFVLTTDQWNEIIHDQHESLTEDQFNELFAQYLIQ